jgi:hypothetical protein
MYRYRVSCDNDWICNTKRRVATGDDGAGYKIRTRDPLITNQVLYQLS